MLTRVNSINLLLINWTKLGLWLLGWSLAMSLLSWLYWNYLNVAGYYRGSIIVPVAAWLGASTVLIQIGCYYWITRLLIPAAMARRWLAMMMYLVLMNIGVSITRFYFMLVIGHHYKNYNLRLDHYTNKFERFNFFTIHFDLMQFFDNWIYVYSLLLGPICVKVILEIYQARTRSLQLELNLLRAQINPHFVFNTLNNIYSIVEEKDAYAADIIAKFSHILHYTFYQTERDYVDLQQEIDSVRDYIELERIRHEQDVIIQFDSAVDEDGRFFPIPPLLLVSLVENAFKHGVNTTIGPAWVHIRLQATRSSLQFDVANSKPKSNSNAYLKKPVITHQIGLNNIKRRLELLYPENHRFVITDLSDTYSIGLSLTQNGKIDQLFTRR